MVSSNHGKTNKNCHLLILYNACIFDYSVFFAPFCRGIGAVIVKCHVSCKLDTQGGITQTDFEVFPHSLGIIAKQIFAYGGPDFFSVYLSLPLRLCIT